ncbi:uncharacterized protein LOC141589729 [Silene latifolia]|uniref:uncharacterized protein LOC141589729 n=1 Tax=Silene latifolia TaxID=37657 RepID=UPI003D785C31
MWETLDVTVLQWIYSTVSNDLLEMIVEVDTTVMATWDRLANIFQDNQNSRAMTLEQEFSHIAMANFPSTSAYCERLKSLADQLKNVGSPVSNNRLVPQMVSGLTEAYHDVGTIIRQANPLPAFYQARSMLTLQEAGLAKQNSSSALYAKGASDGDDSGSSSKAVAPLTGKGGRQNGSGGKKKGKGGKGNNGNHKATTSPVSPAQQPVAPSFQWPAGYGSWQWPSSPWGYPPCPYPTGLWARPGFHQPGILRPRPAQAYTTGAAATLPKPHQPLILKNVLFVPKLVKILVSVRKFTIDNKVSVEFDPFDLCVKDLRTGTRLMRCESRRELYPISSNKTSAGPPSIFAALSSSLWHDRLGHPGAPVFNSLRQNNFIDCISIS